MRTTGSFTHLHVASGYSLRYGASTPRELVATAVEHGLDALALTDRDGVYGAVKFVAACEEAGIAPLLGVDLAVQPSGMLTGLPGWADRAAEARAGRSGRKAPVRGGAVVDPRHPRVTVLALGPDRSAGRPAGAGWARLCRLISATHLRGERGSPVSTEALLGEYATDPGSGAPALAVLLGPDSEFGRAVLARRADLALAVLARWQQLVPREALAVEVVCHRGPIGTPASLGHAARMLAVARQAGVTAVLSNAVRYATAVGAATVDVLDSARRLVPLDSRHLDRVSAGGFLASTAQMTRLAREIARAGGDEADASGLLEATAALAARCRLTSSHDLGTRLSHLPEAHVLNLGPGEDVDSALHKHCVARINGRYPGASMSKLAGIDERLEDELRTIRQLGYSSYFLTIEEVCDLIKRLGVRVAARGSGAGSLVNYLLGISGVDPLRYDLLMERFLSPLRRQLPDIDIDVESARRTEVYEEILERFGAERVTCVSMMDTYRVRHAIRDAGAALGMPPGEIDAIAKAFPHIRARDVRLALQELPELRRYGLTAPRLDLLFDLVERLDGLPRHVALHPCGVVLSTAALLDRTPVEASWQGFPMSQFDKDDVEYLGLLKLDVLGIRMQSAMAHALDEVVRIDGPAAAAAGHHPERAAYLDAATGRIALDAVPHDDEATYRLIRSTRTLGCFQIESPGQRELVGKFGPESFADIIIDISLFRPGPVKSDMVTPFLRARHGWDAPEYIHPSLEDALSSTSGVVVFHEQVLQIVAATTGCTLAEADEFRRMMGSPAGQERAEGWWRPLAAGRDYDPPTVERIWAVLKAFASFGFCKAHAAAFALPTYQSAWLKAHHPAAFYAGVLTHDPGMYPKRLILDDARNFGITVLPLDVNASRDDYRVERLEPARVPDGQDPGDAGAPAGPPEPLPDPGLPDGRGYGIRLSLSEVKGISEAEVARIVAQQPFHDLADFWQRAEVSRPVVERLVLTGAFDSLYGLGPATAVQRRGRITRRDLLLQVAELERWTRSVTRGLPKARRPAARPEAPGRAAAAVARNGARAATWSALGPAAEPGSAPAVPTPALIGAAPAARVGSAPLPGPPGAPAGGPPGVASAGVPPGGAPVAGPISGAPAGQAPGALTTGPPAGFLGAVPDLSGLPGDGVEFPSGDLSDYLRGSMIRAAAARQSRAPRPAGPAAGRPVQLLLDLGDAPDQAVPSGLPEMTRAERVRAELEVLGLDASQHVVDFYAPLLDALGVTRSREVLQRRSRAELLVAGVKVATQTPPVRSGRRVVFLTLDDSTGPVDATFFEDAQGPYAGTVFHSWLLVVRGVLRRTGPRGVSLRATGAWELPVLWEAWADGGLDAVREIIAGDPVAQEPGSRPGTSRLPAAQFHGGFAPSESVTGAARVLEDQAAATGLPAGDRNEEPGRLPAAAAEDERSRAGGMGGGPRHRRVLVHPSGFRQSPYADIKPAGDDGRDARRSAKVPRKLWHASPGSSGR
jgi:error-prone DNA polymerase